MTIINKNISDFWDKYTVTQKAQRLKWWESKEIIRHINKKVCGLALDGFNQGLVYKLQHTYASKIPFGRALSVGCGSAYKEISLLRQNIVQHFDLYELSEVRIHAALANVKKFGLQKRVTIHQTDFFSTNVSANTYDFVHWDNALHHMLDVPNAVKVSHDVLNPGGVFFMNDFVGANRFQWSDIELSYVNRFRALLPPELFYTDKNQYIPVNIGRPSIDKMIQADPSEAADSESIIPAVKNFFPSCFLCTTGGVIYQTALNHILAKISEESPILKWALYTDDVLNDMGLFQYAVAIGEKQNFIHSA